MSKNLIKKVLNSLYQRKKNAQSVHIFCNGNKFWKKSCFFHSTNWNERMFVDLTQRSPGSFTTGIVKHNGRVDWNFKFLPFIAKISSDLHATSLQKISTRSDITSLIMIFSSSADIWSGINKYVFRFRFSDSWRYRKLYFGVIVREIVFICGETQ